MSSTKFTPGPWAAFTDDVAGHRPHTNIVAFRDRTTCVFSLPGHHKKDPDVCLIAAAPELYEALLNIEVLFRRDGENSLDTFERIASQFQKDTGYMRPGKSAPMVEEAPQYDENLRRKKWDEWVDDKLVDARSALKKARGE